MALKERKMLQRSPCRSNLLTRLPEGRQTSRWGACWLLTIYFCAAGKAAHDRQPCCCRQGFMTLLERIRTAASEAELETCQEEYDRHKRQRRAPRADKVCTPC